MSKNTSFKSVVVKEDAKTSLAEAGVYNLTLESGRKIVTLAHLFFPDHDREMFKVVLKYLEKTKPDVVFLLGGIVNEEAFKSLVEVEVNYLHEYEDAPEVIEARKAGMFEDQVLKLGKSCGNFIRKIQKASGANVFYIPSATHLSMPNEVRLMEFIQAKKAYLDQWAANHPEASDTPSDPTKELPKQLDELFGLNQETKIKVLRFGSAVMVNNNTLFMIGDFRRRNPGDASKVEWEQRLVNIVRSFDGKVASSWMTTPDNSFPAHQAKFVHFHEVGHMWDVSRMGHLRDYDKRCQGFWAGTVVANEIFGSCVIVIPGNDGKRSFVVDGVAFTETNAAKLTNGEILKLA